MSLGERMTKHAQRRFGRSAAIVCSKVGAKDGWVWSVEVSGLNVLEVYDDSKRIARLMLHDALLGLSRAADKRRWQAARSSSNDNAYAGAKP